MNIARVLALLSLLPILAALSLPARAADFEADGVEWLHLDRAKPLLRGTSLAGNAKAPVRIYIPATPEHRPIAERIAAAIESHGGARPEIIVATREAIDSAFDRDIIVIGDFKNNPLIFHLYNNFHAFVDDYYPGADGHVLATISDPFGRGHNVILLGSSGNVEALSRAAGIFETRLEARDGKPLFPYTIDVKTTVVPAADPKALAKLFPADEKLNEKDFAHLYGVLGLVSKRCAWGAYLTGDRAYLDAYREAMLATAAWLKEPGRLQRIVFRTMWGNTPELVSGFDLVEEMGAFSDEERLLVTEFLGTLGRVNLLDPYMVDLTPTGYRWNHQNFPATSLSHFGRYFDKYYKLADAQAWLQKARDCYEGQLSIMSRDEAADYLYHLPVQNLEYALASNQWGFVERGGLDVNAKLYVMNIDNLGTKPGFGDCYAFGDYSPLNDAHIMLLRLPRLLNGETLHTAMLEKARTSPYTFTGGPRQNDGTNVVNSMFTIHGYNVIETAPLPADHPLLEYVPIDFDLYGYFLGEEAYPPEALRRDGDFSRSYHKLTLRNGFDMKDQYLLLDGFNRGAHGHFDANAIVTFTDNERVFLMDTDYIRRMEDRHNAVTVIRDGRLGHGAPFSVLNIAEQYPGRAFVQTELKEYNGARWRRNIVWEKERFFAVLDEIEAEEAGDYLLRCNWRTLGDVSLDGPRFTTDQKGEQFHIVNQDGAELKLTEEKKYGERYWYRYVHADPVGKYLTQAHQGVPLKTGESFTFLNLFFTSGPTDGRTVEQSFDLVRLSDRAAVVTEAGAPVAMVAAGAIEAAPVAFEGRLAQLTSESAFLLGLKRFEIPGLSVQADGSPSLSIDGGKVEIRAGKAGNLTFNGRKVEYAAGSHAIDPGQLDAAAMASAFKTAAARASRLDPAKAAPPAGKADQLRAAWTAQMPQAVNRLGFLSDGRLIAADASGRLAAFDSAGRPAWTAELGKAINDIAFGPLDGNAPVIVTGDDNYKVTAFSTDGKPLWNFQALDKLDRKGVMTGVSALEIADVDADGTNEVVAATGFRNAYILSAAGAEQRHDEIYYYGIHDIAAGNARGDNNLEILYGTEYYGVQMLADGELSVGAGAPPPAQARGPDTHQVLMLDVNGDGRTEAIIGQSGGQVACATVGTEDFVWHSNIGGQVRRIVSGDLDGDGSPEIIAGGEGYYLAAFSAADGRERFRRNLHDTIVDIAIVDTSRGARIAAAGLHGDLFILAADGAIERTMTFPAGIQSLAAAGGRLAVGCADGKVSLFDLE